MAKTDYRTMFDKDFIGAWSLPEGKDVTVTITKVTGGQLTGVGGRKTRKPVIYMQGTDKGMALNATNSKTIAAMYGNYVEEWAGKRITLFKTMTTFGSEQMECIRIRPRIPTTKGANVDEPKLTDTPPPPKPDVLGDEEPEQNHGEASGTAVPAAQAQTGVIDPDATLKVILQRMTKATGAQMVEATVTDFREELALMETAAPQQYAQAMEAINGKRVAFKK